MYKKEIKITFDMVALDADVEYIDDMSELDYAEIERGELSCFFDWAKYAHKSYSGFDEKDVSIEVSDGGSFCNVTIVSSLPFDEIIKTHDGDMTLWKAIVRYMNAQISDGIGENEVGFAKYNGVTYSVWINSIVS